MDINEALSHVDNACGNIVGPEYVDGHYFHVHRLRFAHTLASLTEIQNTGRFLEIGSDGVFLRLGRYVLGAEEVAGTVHDENENTTFQGAAPFHFTFHGTDLENRQLPVAPGSFDTVVCGEVIEHMARDPMALLAEINRVLSMGGYCLITTPNIASYRNIGMALDGNVPMNFYKFRKNGSLDRHHIEYTPKLLSEFVNMAGFEIVWTRTHDCWSYPDEDLKAFMEAQGKTTDGRGDNIFLLARKIGDVEERFPEVMYV